MRVIFKDSTAQSGGLYRQRYDDFGFLHATSSGKRSGNDRESGLVLSGKSTLYR